MTRLSACPGARFGTLHEGASSSNLTRVSERAADDGGDPGEIGAAETARATVMSETAVLQTNAATSNLVGMVIDGFAIDGIVGGGAFGTVYRGTQRGLDRAVAFKVPTLESASDTVAARRFAREARAAAAVDHPGVVTIYAVGELPDGRPYIAMQFVDGRPLDKILD